MQDETTHPCERIYAIAANGKTYGSEKGICRITGKMSVGTLFKTWVRDTFTDHAFLKPGTIISNEAQFCFEESSEIIMRQAGKEKPQRFRTYSHIIDADGCWHCVTKADKQLIYRLIVGGATLVCLTDSGQKHLLFKHRTGMWQLDDLFVVPDIDGFLDLHTRMCVLLALEFSQTEIISGKYLQYRIMKAGINEWKKLEESIKSQRGTPFFNFTSWLLFTNK